MQTSERGKAVIVYKEGLVLKAYLCPAGIWTIGVGHTSAAGAPAVKPGMKITRDEAMAILASDLRKFEARTARHVEYERAPDEQAAADGSTSFDFNTGRIHNATWVRHFNAGDFMRARASFMQWTRGGGKVLRGLVKRREIEANMIFDGEYPDDISVQVVTSAKPDRTDAVWVVASTAEQRQALYDGLKKLGYDPGSWTGPDRVPIASAKAVRAFQRDHDLTVDGLIGDATLSTLQRELDARSKTKGAGAGGAAGGATAAGGPAAVEALPPEAVPADVPEALLEPAFVQGAGVVILAVAVLRGAWLAYRYRDVIAARIHGFAPRPAAWLRSF